MLRIISYHIFWQFFGIGRGDGITEDVSQSLVIQGLADLEGGKDMGLFDDVKGIRWPDGKRWMG
jgi:hypothetical protein